jgi:uncharacterized protein (DUF1778 family)
MKTNFDSRLDVRMHTESKKIIERAAHLLGLKAADYARITLEREAKRTLDDSYNIKLTERDWHRFLEILNEDVLPNEALRNAVSQYEEAVKTGHLKE